MKYQIHISKAIDTVEINTDIDGSIDKIKFHINEDGPDEKIVKLLKEFKYYINTYNIWDVENAAHTIYFHRCLAGTPRDQWDLINEINDDKERDNIIFQFHM